MPKIKEITVYDINELNDNAKERALSMIAEINLDYDWWSIDNWLLPEYLSYKKVYFDLYRGEIGFSGLDIADDKAFLNAMGFPEELHDFVDYDFTGSANYGTSGITFSYRWNSDYEDGFNEEMEKKFEALPVDSDAKFSDLIREALSLLSKERDYQTSEAACLETIEANEYVFDQYGNIA